MGKFLRRLRGAIGMGVTWAAAWSCVGATVLLGVVITTGGRPDAPVPLLFAGFGFLGGVTFSGVLGVLGGRRRFAEMSLGRFAAWGGGAGFLLATAFVSLVASGGDPAFLWNLMGVGPAFTLAGAGSAAGSLALARRAEDPERLEAPADVAPTPLPASTEP